MKRSLLRILRCPGCGAELRVERAAERQGEIEDGELRCTGCATSYAIAGFIPRFAPRDNYTSSFGFQWNEFRRTQLDSYSGHPITERRFFAQSAWTAAISPAGWSSILDAAQDVSPRSASRPAPRVVAVDYSNAVDACWLNLGSNPRLHVVQADVYRLPFEKRRFDYVYCFGVMQHTPDVERTFVALVGTGQRGRSPRGGRVSAPSRERTLAEGTGFVRSRAAFLPAPSFAWFKGVVPLLFPVSLAIGTDSRRRPPLTLCHPGGEL